MRTALYSILIATATFGLWLGLNDSAVGWIDEQKSVTMLIDEAELAARENAKNLQVSGHELKKLEGTRQVMQVQRRKVAAELGAHRRVLGFMRSCLDQPGDVVQIACGVKHDRSDVEADLETELDAARQAEVRLQEFDRGVAAMDEGIARVKDSIAEAKAKLRKDVERLRKLQVAQKSYAVQKRIEQLTNPTTLESVLDDDRPFDRKLALAESRMAELGTPRSIPRVGGWRRYALGEAENSGSNKLLSEVDRYLSPQPSGPHVARK